MLKLETSVNTYVLSVRIFHSEQLLLASVSLLLIQYLAGQEGTLMQYSSDQGLTIRYTQSSLLCPVLSLCTSSCSLGLKSLFFSEFCFSESIPGSPSSDCLLMYAYFTFTSSVTYLKFKKTSLLWNSIKNNCDKFHENSHPAK